MIITFVRGLPGSGKSTFARSIMEKTGAILIEPDMFLINNYEYRYTPERWEQAKILAQRIVEGIAQRQHADIIYADVLPRVNDVDSIVRDLQWYGVTARYFVWEMPRITREESIARNRHNVRPEDIDQMIRDWEPYPGAIHTSAKDMIVLGRRQRTTLADCVLLGCSRRRCPLRSWLCAWHLRRKHTQYPTICR